MNMFEIKKFLKENREVLIAIFIPIVLGLIVGLITKNGMRNIKYLNLPEFYPPAILFPIVWTILYGLMGYSAYLVYSEYSCYNRICLLIYFVQLIINLLWSIIFFNLELRLFALIWLILLDIVVIYMIWCFYGINKKAAYYQIPYLVWIIFATFLNYTIYVLNR